MAPLCAQGTCPLVGGLLHDLLGLWTLAGQRTLDLCVCSVVARGREDSWEFRLGYDGNSA